MFGVVRFTLDSSKMHSSPADCSAKRAVQRYCGANMFFICFLKSWIKGFDTQLPRSTVHCWNESHWQTTWVVAGPSEGTHHMVKSRYAAADPAIKAHCLCFVQASKGIPVSLESRTVKRCGLPKGSERQVYISVWLKLYQEYCRKTRVWIDNLLEWSPGWVARKGFACVGWNVMILSSTQFFRWKDMF